jgi:hypothetical protein
MLRQQGQFFNSLVRKDENVRLCSCEAITTAGELFANSFSKM